MNNANEFLESLLSPDGLEKSGAAHDEHDRMFNKGLAVIWNQFEALPRREANNDAVNATFDGARISFIIYCLNYLKIYSQAISKVIQGQTSQEARDYITGLSLHYKMHIFKAITFVIFNASGEFKSKYKAYLGPAPFSWETFEHFGAVMTDSSHKSIRIFQENTVYESIGNVREEFYNKQVIAETAVDKVIVHDLDNLLSFFKMIKEHHVDKKADVELKPHQFFSIKAVTKRVLDAATFMNLLNLTSNIRMIAHDIKDSSLNKNAKNDFNTALLLYPAALKGPKVKLDRMVHVHAALRRLEMIGELLTGKFFSPEWKALDDSVDWNAFNILRDVIAHQDEGDNHTKVQNLLQNKNLLSAMLDTDLPELHQKLQIICVRRYTFVATYQKDKEVEFIDAIVTKEIELNQIALANNIAPQPVEAKVKLTKEERLKKRQDDMDAAAARKKEAADKLLGLNNIRQATAIFTQNSNGATLNPKKRVQLALDALNNITELLKAEAGIHLTKITESNVILDAIHKDEFLEDAINYNIEQFLQHLERIKDYEGINNTPIIATNYDSLRYLRNHIAHGALLLDTEEFRPDIGPLEYSVKQRKVVVALKNFVINFPPILKKAMNKIEEKEKEKARTTGKMRQQK